MQRRRNTTWTLLLLLMGLMPEALFAAARATTVKLDQRTGLPEPAGKVPAVRGEPIYFQVDNTNPQCFDYNLIELESLPETTEAPARPLAFDQSVTLTVARHEGAAAYKIDVTRREGAGHECTVEGGAPRERHWTIQVRTDGWTVGFSGAFTVDSITDPVYGLEPGKRTKPGAEEEEDGFFVRRQSDKEDDTRLGAAAMFHLYDSDPHRLGGGGVNWVPLSFGIGVGEGEGTRYFFGTGIRFEDKVFVTVGGMAGQEKRLPGTLEEGSFTADANALGGSDTRTSWGWFVSVSLSMADIDLAAPFKSVFGEAAPQDARTGAAGGGDAGGGS